MFEVEAIMETNVITVKKDTPIYEAIQMLVDNKITGLPVVNDGMALTGMITEKDVLELLYNFEDKPGKVEDFMTKTVISFDHKDSLNDITESFMKNHFRRVPIVMDGKLVGIVSRKDVIRYISRLRQEDSAAAV